MRMAQPAGPQTPSPVAPDRPVTGAPPGPALARDRFEAAVRTGPDRLAVSASGKTLSYRELNRRAEQVARILRGRGIGPDAVVGVCLGSSIERIVALLGVLKSGAGSVPIDPALPAERLAFILTDSGATTCLTEAALAPLLPAAGLDLLFMDRPLPAASPATNVDSRAGPDDLAYLVYTSGSTGRPKGVEVPQRALANLVASWIDAFGVTPADRASPICGPGFDANVAEIWPYLCAGASLHLPDDETRLSPTRLIAWWADNAITMSIAPTPLAEALIGEPWPAHLAMRYLFTGGDKLRRRPPGNWPARFENQYGPSEASVLVTSGPVEPSDGADADPPSIGRPFGHAELHVLDPAGVPVAAGEAGELYIGGPGLARGYRHRPDLTAERFVPDPFTPDTAARLYRTGDRVRLRSDGGYDFLGRLDDQVKLRGYRIELGEIETVLSASEDVAAAVAAVREDQPGLARLIAYLVPARGRTLHFDTLRRQLAQSLPGYMVPSAMVPIAAVPLTPNGKPDRAALPPPRAEHFLRSAYVPPRTSLERRLAAIWSDVLGVRDVGIHDRFLDLGGHSLVALAILSRLRDELGIDLALGEFLAQPTVAALAAATDGRLGRSAPVVATEPVDWERFRDHELERSEQRSPIYRFPAAASQQRLWLIDQMAPGSAAYNLPLALEIRGALDRTALARALADLMHRHAALRTVLKVTDGKPYQVVLPAAPVDVPVTPLNGGETRQAEAIAAFLRDEANRPFDLVRGPLFRAHLAVIGPEHHVLALTLHHVTTDGWSTEVLFADLGACYRARAAHHEPEPPSAAMRYADWTMATERMAATDTFAAQERHWLAHLSGELPVLELPADHKRPPLVDFAGDVIRVDLPPTETDRLTAMARAAGVTPFAAFLAAYAQLLRRYTGQESLVIGTPIAGRRLAGSERTIGFLANTLALRLDLAGVTTFAGILSQAGGETLRAAANGDYPFDRLVERLRPRRDPSRNPVFQTLFTLNHGLPPLPDMGDLAVSQLVTDPAASRFDLSLSVTEADGRWSAAFEYATALFSRATVVQMARHFAELLAQLTDAADDVRALPRLGPAERETELFERNRTACPIEAETVDRLVARQVRTTPDAAAVVGSGEQLTYRELDRRASALAARLAALGIASGDLVGLCLERTVALPVAMLAILKAGAAYLPLDPSLPVDRLRYIVTDAGARLIVTESPWQDRFDPATPLCLLDLPANEAADPIPGPPVEPERPAYVIYTSGSTGRPKGVVVPNRALVNFLASMGREPGLSAADRLLAVTTLSFDIAGLEIWLPLVTGATVVIASREETTDGRRLAEALDREAISVMQATPATWRLLLEQGWEGRAGLTMLAGGEALPADLITPLLARGKALWNLYGPTETTIWSAVSRIVGPGPVHLGEPVDNTCLYVLDERREPVPLGVAGELWIGGAGVSLGYHNRPDLTRERFVADPWHHDPPGMMYRTGDRVRRRRDGTIEYLGRLDTQVKIRGYRIELGEIESALGDLADVARAAVVVRGSDDRTREITAFVVAKSAGASPAAWRATLAAGLPEYMLPSRFVLLEALPITPNGKIDRQDLASRTLAAEAAAISRPPANPEEELLLELWRDLLPGRAIGVTDDFFGMGGHSLLGARMLAQLVARTGVTLPLTALLTGPTIEALAARITTERAGGGDRAIVLNPAGRRPPLVFLHGDFGGGGLYCRRLAALLGEDQPLVVLDTPREASDEGSTIERTATTVIARMKAVQPTGPYRLGGWCNGGLVAWDMARQLEATGDRVDLLFLLDADAQNSHFPWARRLFQWIDWIAPTAPKAALERRSKAMIRIRYYGFRLRTFREKTLGQILAFIPGFFARLARRLAWRAGIVRRGEAPVEISFETNDTVEWRNWLRLSTRAAASYFPSRTGAKVSLAFTRPSPEDEPLDPTLGWARIAPNARITWLESDHIEAVGSALPQTADALTSALTAADSDRA